MRLFYLCCRRPWLVVTLAILSGLAGSWAASRLDLRTAFSELLPHDDPGVVTLNATQARMGDLSLLLVGVRSPDLAASERYAKDLSEHLAALPKNVCEFAAYHMRDVHAFFAKNRWLYASEDDLTEIRDRLRRELTRRKNPLFVDLSSDDADEDEAFEKRLREQSLFAGKFPDGLFKTATSNTLWVAALPSGGIMGERPGEALLREARLFVQSHPPATYHPQMDVELAGPAVTPVRNREALERDLWVVGALCFFLIPLSIAVFFRRALVVGIIFAPAVLATVLSYAFAFAVFGYLTTVTSFLVSFIMGNGTNYAIVLMARYENERHEGLNARDAVLAAASDLWRTTGVAAIASAVSYVSLVVTSFRGFSQFGLMGAAGCLLAWLCTFTLVPALVCLVDKKGPAVQRRRLSGGALHLVAGAIAARGKLILVGGTMVSALLGAGLLHFSNDAFEYDFRKLSAPGITNERLRSFDKDKDALFGRWPQPTIVLADQPNDVEPIKQAIRRRDEAAPGPNVIGQMVSVADLLPGTEQQQRSKLALIEQIRKLVNDPAAASLEAQARARLEEIRPPENLGILGANDLPPIARRPFTEADGSVGKVLLLYPPERGLSVWDGHALLRIASVVQNIPLPDGRVIASSGSAVVFASMLRSVLHDGPIATLASMIGVLILVLFRVRPLKDALFVLGALGLGVFWMCGIAGWFGVKISFVNFIALPFIFGVGVEYAIHVVTEYRSHGNVVDTIVSAGGPVALCSWSAILGYGSLLVARNGALQGLGALATLGEVACLAAAVLVLPALLFRLGRNSPSLR